MAKNEVQFGNWDKEDVEYTTYFEKAAVKGKKGNKTNQNGPQETTPKHSRHTSREESEMRRPVGSPLHSDAVNPKPAVIGSHQQRQGGGGGLRGSDMHHRPRHQHQRQVSREEGDMMMRRPVDTNANQQKSSAQNSPYHRYGGGETTPKRGGVGVGTTRQSVGSDRSIEHSPLHLHSQGKAGGGGGGRGTSSSVMSSPSWERKGLAEGLAPSTPGRSRLRSVTKGDDTPDHGPAVPKFGDWDENDPASAEGYTHIFNKVREEKQIGAGGKGPSMPNDRTSYANGRKRIASGTSTVCGCFPWSR